MRISYFLFPEDCEPGIEAGSTKPHFVDINDDGNLDLIYGEMNGYFIQFNGSSPTGINHFLDQAQLLNDVDGNPLNLRANSTPYFIDWDGDKDLDLISGAYNGAVHFAENIGTAKEAKWKAFAKWIPGPDRTRWQNPAQNIRNKITPGVYSSVSVLDHNNDGKLDLIVGDQIDLDIPHQYISDEEFATKEDELVTMQTQNRELLSSLNKDINQSVHRGDNSPESEAEIRKLKVTYEEQRKLNRQQEYTFERSFKSFKRKGVIWIYLQK